MDENMNLQESINELINLYYIKKDNQKILDYLCEDITWIGTGKNEISFNKTEVKTYFEQEKAFQKIDLDVQVIEQKIELLNEKYAYSLLSLEINTSEDQSFYYHQMQRVTLLMEKQQKSWKVKHIHFSTPDKELLDGCLAQQKFDIINNQDAFMIDTLTKIANQDGFVDKVSQILEENPKQSYALIKFGIRNFRYVNKLHGFEMGDNVLKNIAKNLSMICQEKETCARIEKDCFAALLKFKDKKTFDLRMWEIRNLLIDEQLITYLGYNIQFTAGIYVSYPPHIKEIKTMLDNALLAKDAISKFSVESNFEYFDENMYDQKIHHVQLLSDIEKAYMNDEFEVYFQPQFDIKTKEIVSAEALSRWKKEGQVITPDRYIPIMEGYGTIKEFDQYMIKSVCKIMRRWIDQKHNIIPISINQSRMSFMDTGYVSKLCEIIDEYQIPHKLITIEITESAFLGESERGYQELLIKVIKQLHDADFSLAIDDFGTGYANTKMLSVILADVLKIDKSLLEGIENNKRVRIVIRKIIEIAHETQIKVVCEGIENEKQLKALKQLQCDIGQGFLVSKGLETDKFTELIS